MKPYKILCSIFLVLILTNTTEIIAQTKYDPKNLLDATKFLSKHTPTYLKTRIKNCNKDSLKDLVPPWNYTNKYYVIANWTITNKNTRFQRYFSNINVTSRQDQASLILQVFKNFLNNKPLDIENIIKQFQNDRKQWHYKDSSKLTADSIEGIYIPSNLNDCFTQLDRFWSDSLKNVIRNMSESKFTAGEHLNSGMWIRNNWGLHRGSRLTKFFNNIGVSNAEGISGIIITSYYRYLKGINIDLAYQISNYSYYNGVTVYPPESTYPEGITHSSYYGTMHFNRKNNEFEPIYFWRNPKTKSVWLSHYFFGWVDTKQEEFEIKKNLSKNQLRKLFKKKHK
ncbi:MAG TPA: hypothetical protein PLU37_14410 [Chitinophagaceae bacterium]|nr:hypothetical protein [Chitinophagales bacterium]HPG12722.1 hypothetical protein [Chitinophagaceae bacterium]HRX94092.1 hypothetical protein [Chitinophagaceae bacterium]